MNFRFPTLKTNFIRFDIMYSGTSFVSKKGVHLMHRYLNFRNLLKLQTSMISQNNVTESQKNLSLNLPRSKFPRRESTVLIIQFRKSEKIDFQQNQICTELLALINLMITAFINHRNRVPCAMHCASIITSSIGHTIVFPILYVVLSSLSLHLISIPN